MSHRRRAALEHARLLDDAQVGRVGLLWRNCQIDATFAGALKTFSRRRQLLSIAVSDAEGTADTRGGRLSLDIASQLGLLWGLNGRSLTQVVILLR